MISEQQTNEVFFSDLLPKRFGELYKEIIFHLNHHNIPHQLIENTNDIWCRDYMPIQINSEEFVQFNFCPSYLWKFKKYQPTITATDKLVYKVTKKGFYKTAVKLDGGNVVKFDNKVILTDRVFEENKLYEFNELINELKELFRTDKVIIVPQLPGDFTGHADGMIRFVDGNKLIVNDFGNVGGNYYRSLKLSLLNTGFDIVELPYGVKNQKSSTDDTGNYINFLEVKNLIFLPFYGCETDGLAHYEMKKHYKDRQIIPIYCNELTKHGGGLNCITWTIKQ